MRASDHGTMVKDMEGFRWRKNFTTGQKNELVEPGERGEQAALSVGVRMRARSSRSIWS